jgi:hypothetical protein
MVVRCRVYVVTGRNKLVCSPLVLLIALQAVWTIVLPVHIVWQAGEFFDTCPFTPIYGHPAPQLPVKILDLFTVCTSQLWAPGALASFGTALAFGPF